VFERGSLKAIVFPTVEVSHCLAHNEHVRGFAKYVILQSLDFVPRAKMQVWFHQRVMKVGGPWDLEPFSRLARNRKEVGGWMTPDQDSSFNLASDPDQFAYCEGRLQVEQPVC